MNSEWAKFYESRVNSASYMDYFRLRYSPFIKMVQQYFSPRSAEFGCGIGSLTKCLQPNSPLYLVDINAEMLELTKNNEVKGELIQHDILKPFNRKLDLIYSHGVLEHFDTDQVKQIIRNQRATGAKLIHYVPTDKYGTPSFGDERLLSPEFWYKTFKPSRALTFNGDYDLILIWE